MKLQDIEKHLKSQLSEIPNDDSFEISWDKLAADLDAIDEEQKKRPFPIILIFLGSALVGLGLLYQMSSTTFDQLAVVESDDTNTVTIPVEYEEECIEYDPSVISGDISYRDEVIADNKSITTAENVESKRTETNIQNTVMVDFIEQGTTSSTITQSVQAKNKTTTNRLSDIEVVATQPVASSSVDAIEKATMPETSIALVENIALKWQYLDVPKRSVHLIPNITVEEDIPGKKKEHAAPDKQLKKNKWSIAMEAGLHQHSWSMKAPNAETTTYLDFRNETEKSTLGYQGGLRFQYDLSARLYLGSGLNYKRYWTKAQAERTFTQQVMKSNVLIKQIINPNTGEVIDEVYGDAEITQHTHRRVDQNNQFDQVQLPLYLGYELIKRKKWALGLEFGGSIGYWVKREGAVIGKEIDLDLLVFDNNNTTLITTKKTLTNGYISPIINWQISPIYTMYFRGVVEQSFNDWLGTADDLQIKPMDFGVVVGVNYKL